MTQKLKIERYINIKNRRASFEYQLLDSYVAGIVLQGTEIKSIRQGKVDLSDGYCFFENDELYVKELRIAPYEKGTYYNHSETRPRKLLLRKTELRKITIKSQDIGITLIPTRLFINDKGLAKLEFALARGKKLHDKRDSIKERDVKKELSRHLT